MAKLLVIDDDRTIRETLELAFMRQNHTVSSAETAAKGLELWKIEQPDVVLLDLMLPDGDGIEILTEAKSSGLKGHVILITGHQDLDRAISAMKAGAFDYIHKPLNIDELEITVSRALAELENKLKLALVADLAAERTDEKIVGQSPAIIEIHKKIGMASRGQANILITGESGTGKELVARAIHKHSAPNAPFIPVNCSAFVPTLLESELFGHEKGAFTGANESKPGRFELAGEGTLFLDEIGDLELALQVKLLRVLQENSFERVGGNRSLPFNARVIAATHQNLEEMVRAGDFRNDLYFRLKVIEIDLPPLRDRPEDIEPLVEALLVRVNRKLRRSVNQVALKTLTAMKEYQWPGNVRELENRLTAGVMLSSGEMLNMELPIPTSSASPNPEQSEPLNRSLKAVEKAQIEKILKATGGSLGETCGILGIARPTLRRKMIEYNLSTD
ncbi:sigma-54 dependent transcriptional regulator [bacterium]|nr:sigma-54 dependent transcriptional regulator [bacterium]